MIPNPSARLTRFQRRLRPSADVRAALRCRWWCHDLDVVQDAPDRHVPACHDVIRRLIGRIPRASAGRLRSRR
jgi:hypothetical protein